MIQVTTFLNAEMFFTVVKLPFVQKVEILKMSNKSRNQYCLYRCLVYLKDIAHFTTQIKGNIQAKAHLFKRNPERDYQQLTDMVIEFDETGKISSKKFKQLVEFDNKYGFGVPNKKELLKQIEIIKSLSMLK